MSSYNPGAMPTFLSTCKVINIPPSNTHLNLAELSWLPTCWLHLVSLSFLEAHVLHRLLNCGCTRVRTWRPFACLQHSVDLRTGSAPLCRGLKSIGGLPMTFKSLPTVVQTSFLPDRSKCLNKTSASFSKNLAHLSLFRTTSSSHSNISVTLVGKMLLVSLMSRCLCSTGCTQRSQTGCRLRRSCSYTGACGDPVTAQTSYFPWRHSIGRLC